MLVLHNARWRDHSYMVCNEDRLLVAFPIGLQLTHPGVKLRRYLLQRQLGLTFQRIAEILVAQTFRRVCAEPFAQLRNALRWKRKANRVRMAAESCEDVMTALNGVQQVKRRDG